MPIEDYKVVVDTLNRVSPTMCAAKWAQVTLYLHNGRGHSCHHPMTHLIPAEGLSEDPSLLHNTRVKIRARNEMLEGQKPSECEYCWRIEQLDTNSVSDRLVKSASTWSDRVMEKMLLPYDEAQSFLRSENIVPSYVEVMFSSVCSFQCVYCVPEVSSKIQADAHQNGPYLLSGGRRHADLEQIQDRIPLPVTAPNPYVEAFEKWLPEIYDSLHTLRVTGGEPTLHKEFWGILARIKRNPNLNMEFAVNTNLGFDKATRQRLVAAVNAIVGKVRQVRIYTSLESTGEQAEWTRYGLDYRAWRDNLRILLNELDPKVRFGVMTTVNATCYNTYHKFLEEMLALKETFGADQLTVTSNYLRFPAFLDLQYLPNALKESMASNLEPYSTNACLNTMESSMVQRLIDYLRSGTIDAAREMHNHDLYLYVNEVERRRKKEAFARLFPELWAAIDRGET